MFSKECCHILNIQFELFLVLVTNACPSQDYHFVSFYTFPYTFISTAMTSPKECHSLMLGNPCLLGNQNVENYSSLHIVKPQASNKDTQMKQALVFSKPKKCKKTIDFKRQKLSQKVIGRIQMLKAVIELHLYKD